MTLNCWKQKSLPLLTTCKNDPLMSDTGKVPVVPREENNWTTQFLNKPSIFPVYLSAAKLVFSLFTRRTYVCIIVLEVILWRNVSTLLHHLILPVMYSPYGCAYHWSLRHHAIRYRTASAQKSLPDTRITPPTDAPWHTKTNGMRLAWIIIQVPAIG